MQVDSKKFRILNLIIIMEILVATIAVGMLYQLELMHHINFVLVCVFMGSIAVYCLNQSYLFELLNQQELFDIKRFAVMFTIALVCALFFPMITHIVWPFLFIFVMLSLFSNTLSGIMLGATLLYISVYLANGTALDFVLYFSCGVVGSLVFRCINEEFKVGLPIFIAELVQLIAGMFLCVNDEELNPILFIFLIVNLLITFILLLVILKIYSVKIVYVGRDKFLELTDPESKLLQQLKENYKDDYYKALHVAYFCDRICKKMDRDEQNVKIAAYYHNIGNLLGKNTWENVSNICRENQFPEEIIDIICQAIDNQTTITSTEAVILYFSEYVVSSVLYIYEKDPKVVLDQNKIVKLINTIFEQKLTTGKFKNSDISLKEIEAMKNTFIEEKLYYDFLR